MPYTSNLLGKHKHSPEWYTPDYVWGWVEFIFDCNRSEIFDPCPIGGAGGLELDWSKHKLIYVNPPSPASKWASRTISYIGQKETSLLYLSFSEGVIWQNPTLLTCPTMLIRRRIKFIPSIPVKVNSPSNYNALHLINGNKEQLRRFIRVGNTVGTVIQSNILS